MLGLFDDFFDFDGNGEMDFLETVAETAFINEMMREEDEAICGGYDYDDEEDDDYAMTELDPDDYDF